jgi:iron complex transport system substrate-binding protein
VGGLAGAELRVERDRDDAREGVGDERDGGACVALRPYADAIAGADTRGVQGREVAAAGRGELGGGQVDVVDGEDAAVGRGGEDREEHAVLRSADGGRNQGGRGARVAPSGVNWRRVAGMSEGLRVACLVPSATDLALRLGLQVVGVSHECDHPAARGLPVLTRSRVTAAHPEGPGAGEVDRAVRAAVAEGGPLYIVDRERLAALAPDVVLSQAICDVCAARADTCDLPRGARLLELTAGTLAGLNVDIRAVAGMCGVAARGELCAAEVAAELSGLLLHGGPRRPRVVTLEWSDPPFLGGHWVPELVEIAGGEHLLSGTGERSRVATWGEVIAADPEVVVFMPCGYSLAAAEAEARSLPALPGALWATAAGRLFSRCTPDSVVAGARVLAAVLRGEPVKGLARRIRP